MMKPVSKKVILALVCLVIAQATEIQEPVTDACNACMRNAEQLQGKLATPLHPRSLVRTKDEACQSVGACSRREELVQVARGNDDEDLQCVLCEYVAKFLKEQVEDPATQEELIENANQVCQTLPEDLKSQCLTYVAQYGHQIFEFFDTQDPEELCALAALCDETRQMPQLPETLKPTVKQLFELQDDDTCNTCQLVIVQASAALSDPKTQREVLKYVKQQCSDFQAFQEQCENYVELYGPLALNMAKQYLTPDLCNQLGFCSQQSSDALPFSA